MRKLNKILRFLRERYRTDPRALSLLRIGVGLVVIIDLLIRVGDVKAFYTDEGIWPRDLVHVFSWKWSDGSWSFHHVSGSAGFIYFLFALHLLCALALLFGFRTKLFTLLTWLFTISLHNRNVFILQSGDDLLRMVLFWGLFLPWGAHYSLDAKNDKRQGKPNMAASLGYLLLLASVYLFSAALKTSGEWRSEGSAIYYALSLEQIRLPGSGDVLYQFPVLMKLLTHVVFWLEILIPVLILWPSKIQHLRTCALLCMVMLHTGIALSVFVGLFPLICIISALGLLPRNWLNIIDERLAGKRMAHHMAVNVTSRLTFPWLRNAFLLFVIVVCLLLNLQKLPWFGYETRDEVTYVANALRLGQNWGMFSPDVMKKDGWFVYYGNDSIGRQWDLRLNQDYVDFSKPEHIVSMYKNDRWRKLAEYLQDDHFNFLRPRFCNYVLRKWNKDHPEKKIALLNLYFMEKQNLPDYKTSSVKKSLYCVCNGS